MPLNHDPKMRAVVEDDTVLVVEELDSEAGVVNRRRWEEDEQAPLLQVEEPDFEDIDSAKSTRFDDLPWYRRPSVCLRRSSA
jgi:hypothetical protein